MGSIPLLGKGGARGGSVNFQNESARMLTEPPLTPPLPRRGIKHPDSNLSTPSVQSVGFLELNTLIVLFEDLFVGCAIHRHAKCSDLAHSHTVAPTPAVESHPDQVAFSITFFVEIEEA